MTEKESARQWVLLREERIHDGFDIAAIGMYCLQHFDNVCEALDLLKKEPWRVPKLINNANKVRKELSEAGFKIIDGRTAIVPVIVGNDELAFAMWRKLYDAGVFVNVFISPGVPQGRQMMRTSYMSTHEDEHLDFIINTFKKVGKEIGLI